MTTCHEYLTIEEVAALCGIELLQKKLLPWKSNDRGSRDPLFTQRMKNWVAASEQSARLK